jgi:hypothetical protein
MVEFKTIYRDPPQPRARADHASFLRNVISAAKKPDSPSKKLIFDAQQGLAALSPNWRP